jgi:Na+/H+ antiporter NhaB
MRSDSSPNYFVALYCLAVVVNIAVKCYSIYLRRSLEQDAQQHITLTGQSVITAKKSPKM